MFSTDPFVVDPSSSQAYNPYSYAFNNPLKYKDPNGKWAIIDDVAGIMLGGIINVICNTDNIHNLGDFGAYFAVGALAGEATVYGGPGAGGAVLGLGNNVYSQASAKGFDHVNWGDAIVATGVGAVVASATSAVTNKIGNAIISRISEQTVEMTASVESDAVIGTLPVGDHVQMEVGALCLNVEKGAVAAQVSEDIVITAPRPALTNSELIEKAATMAETNIGGVGRFAGRNKHAYASKVLDRYQRIYGDRGLETDQFFNRGSRRGFLDVVDHANKTIYDFKFGYPGKTDAMFMRTPQMIKYQSAFPDYSIQIIRP
jgi:hypothetical protein